MTAKSSSLRLLVINEFFYPDVCASSAVLSDHLPRIAALRPDWRITVLTGDRAWDRPEVCWPDREQWDRIDIVRVPRPPVGRTMWRRGRGFVAFHRAVARAGKRLPRPGIIMASTAPPLGGRLGLKLARHFGCPLIYKVLDLYPDCAIALGVLSRRGIPARIWKRNDTAVMRNAAAAVAVSRGIRDRILHTRGIPADQVHLIYDGFDPDRVRPVPREQNAFRREHGLADRFIVQYAGNMGLSHPFDTILAAAEQLTSDARFVFQFIGAGPGRATIERARRRRAADRIRLLDYQPAARLAEVLSAADVALISQAHGLADLSLPYKFYGILAAARPAVFVGPACSEIVDYYRDADCGLHVEQGNVAGLVSTLQRLASDETLRHDTGRRGRALLESRFTSARAARRWVDLIQRIVAL